MRVLFVLSPCTNLIQSQWLKVPEKWHWKIPKLGDLKAQRVSWGRTKDDGEVSFFDRAGRHDVFSTAASVWLRHRHAHGSKNRGCLSCSCREPGWACQLSSPYRLLRLRVGKTREQVRGTERAKDRETKEKTVTEGYEQREEKKEV